MELEAEEFVASEVVIGGTLELVGAGLGHGVDGGAGEARVADVVGRHVNRDLLDGVEGERVEERGETRAVEAEGVVDAGTVDQDRVVAVVLAEGGDLRLFAVAEGFAKGHERGGADDVGDGAFGAGFLGEDLLAEEYTGAEGAAVELVGEAFDREGLKGDDIDTLDGEAHVDLTAEGGGDTRLLGGAEAIGFHQDGVGTADDQRAQVVAAAGVGGGVVGRVGGDVRGGDGGTRDGRAGGVAHGTGDTGGGHLSKRSRGSNDDREGCHRRQPTTTETVRDE